MTYQERQRLIDKCDSLFSKVVRARGRCERCQKTGSLQTSHIISRKFMATRWDYANAFAYCGGCHLWRHHEPDLYARYLEQTYPGRFDQLNIKRQAIMKVDLQIAYLMLKHDLAALKK